jgi:glc operon protein GlcG
MFGTTQYLTLAGAQKMMAAAEAEAVRNKWAVAVAIVDGGANLVAFQKMDLTQVGSIDIAIGKARTAVRFKRSTKMLEDMIAGGRQVFLALEGIVPVQGGLIIEASGAVVGAIGVSGLTSPQDEQVAMAALAVVAT